MNSFSHIFACSGKGLISNLRAAPFQWRRIFIMVLVRKRKGFHRLDDFGAIDADESGKLSDQSGNWCSSDWPTDLVKHLSRPFSTMSPTIPPNQQKTHFSRRVRSMLLSKMWLPTIPTPLSSASQQCPAGTRTQPATRYFFRYPTRFSFRNHRVACNPKHRVLPDILGKPEVSGTTGYFFHPSVPSDT